MALQLAHAHGLGLSLLNIVYALCLRQVRPSAATLGSVASLCLLWSTAIMPLGFLLGGAVTRDGDPGPGVFLVPLGAFLLCIGVLLAARELSRSLSESSEG